MRAHIENLNLYLLITSSLVPPDPTLSRFCIRHPDLQQSNIVVSRSPDSGCQVVGLIDWQHASILPMFLLAGVPQRLQNYDDPVSQSMTLPSLPEDSTSWMDPGEPERRRSTVNASSITTMSRARRSATSSTMLPLPTPCTRSAAVSSNTLVARGRVKLSS